jgi:hypothetical protein
MGALYEPTQDPFTKAGVKKQPKANEQRLALQPNR